ncbi:MAG: hypothetical protein ICV62_14340 [Cyanobacteria bacterium Co-bin13]|nr:hypothetical protein [Cyanobacteria bacterium Co-bin13]
MASSTEQSTYKGKLPQKQAQLDQSAIACRPDFDIWAAAVREQMLAVLQKRSAN